MAALREAIRPRPVERRPRYQGTKGGLLSLLRTTDHKQIGILYLSTSFGFFLVGGLMALLMRRTRAFPRLVTDDFVVLNMISTVGAFVLGLSVLPFLWNVLRGYRYGESAEVDGPRGYGNSLEWATTCPPPRHNFTALPRVRSERPAFEPHYPHMSQRWREENHVSPFRKKAQPATPSEKLADVTKSAEG